ncbi:MAG: hypothetical protein ABSC06_25025 [Rhodopila sp.]
MDQLRQEPAAVRVESSAVGVDLSQRHRLVMPAGPGRSGRTLLCRWMIERALQRGDKPTLATADAARPALKLYFPDAIGPGSIERTPAWLETLFSRLMKSPRTLVLDTAADMTLAPILAQLPTLYEALHESGVDPVMLYTLTPRTIDLTVLDAMETLGFKPPATALVLNIGCTETPDPDYEFRQLRRHPIYKAALDRGAIEVWMPRLYAAKAIEARTMTLHRAADVAGGLDVFDRTRTYQWLAEMERSFAGISTWMP